jgi:FSR family fosmidomycin resistance protein-like MFS transporter
MNTKRLFAATWGHFSIDIVNSSVAMILVAVAGRFDLSISKIGLGALVYQISAAMSQPLFGGLTDRFRGRWVGAVGLLWTLLFYGVAMLAPTYPIFLALLMVGGLGSGAFHAAGLLNASVSGGATRRATATSIFFVGGQTGLAMGPLIAGIVLARGGLPSMAWVAFAMVPAALLMLLWMNDPLPIPKAAAPRTTSAGEQSRRAVNWTLITTFILLITFRSGTAQSFATLLPKYYADMGLTSATYGVMLSVFALAGAVGTFLGGYFGDRVDRRLLIFAVTMGAAPLAWLMLHVSGVPFFLVAVGAGLLLSVPHSVVLVLAQELAPGRQGLVGGLVLGFIFASGSAVAWIASMAADRVGLGTVLSWLAWMPILAGLTALLLPAGRHVEESEAPATQIPPVPELIPAGAALAGASGVTAGPMLAEAAMQGAGAAPAATLAAPPAGLDVSPAGDD